MASAKLADEERNALLVAVVEDVDRPLAFAKRSDRDRIVGGRITVATHEIITPNGRVAGVVDSPVPVGNGHRRLDHPQLLFEEEHELPVPREKGWTHVRGHHRAAER